MKSIRVIIFLLVTVIIVSIVLIVFFITSSTPRGKQPTVVVPTPFSLKGFPTGERINISGIPVKNPYISPAQLDTQGDSLMVREAGFELVYLKQFGEFLISITDSPFEANRRLAETAFLKRLGITQEEACRLNVSITTPISINPTEAGQKYPLSFCP